jgi:hypothetical protein
LAGKNGLDLCHFGLWQTIFLDSEILEFFAVDETARSQGLGAERSMPLKQAQVLHPHAY